MLHTSYDCHERIDTLSLGHLYIPASNLPSMGWVLRKIQNPETVAQHQIRSAMMVARFKKEIEDLGANTGVIQDTLLLHDIAEPDYRVGDITPHCNISAEEKRRREEDVIREMFRENPYALKLWLDYEDGKTLEGRLSKEFDKLQSIEQARIYEDDKGIAGLTEEFFNYYAIRKRQIQTGFLLCYAINLYENKHR